MLRSGKAGAIERQPPAAAARHGGERAGVRRLARWWVRPVRAMEDDAIWVVTAKLGAGLDGAGLVELIEEAGLEIVEADDGLLPRAVVRAGAAEIALLRADHGRSVAIEPSSSLLMPAAGSDAAPRRNGA